MSHESYICHGCGEPGSQERGAVNRARKRGMRLFCSRACAGLARRIDKADEQKRAEKAAYDRVYRDRDPEARRASKREYHRATYDPAVAAVKRKRRMPKHVEYCRRPEYRAKKQEYDRRVRASEYGEFADAYSVALDIAREVAARMTRAELDAHKGTVNKKLNRRRDYERLVRIDA